MQELAFTLANGIAYAQAAVDAGLSPDEFGERLSFFFNAHNHFFQEVAKFRAARRLWAEIMRDRFGATNPKAQALRFHAQTGGSTLTAQQPENNIVRVAIQALSAVSGGAQSIHTNSFDEALALPTERAARIALRTQQLLAHEAGGTDTADPFGGSYFVEALTDELEARARELIARVDELGGAVAAVEQGFVQGEIEEAAFRYSQEVESGERVIVGVNRYEEAEPEPIELHRIDPEAERRQLERTARVRAERDAGEARGGTRARARGRARDREPAPAAARGAARPLHDRRALQRPARGVRHVRRAARAVRILLVSQMYPGPDDPDLGVFVAQLERALARARPRARAGGARLARRRQAALRDPRAADVARGPARSSRTSSTRTSSCPPGLLAAVAGKAPLVVTAHGRDVRNVGAIRGVGTATRATVRHAEAVIAVSDYLRRELEAKVPQARGKTEVVDSGVDLERFRVEPAPEDGPHFLCVGSLTERKNVVRLADAFARLGEGTLTFVGDGPLRAAARRPRAGRARRASSRTTSCRRGSPPRTSSASRA